MARRLLCLGPWTIGVAWPEGHALPPILAALPEGQGEPVFDIRCEDGVGTAGPMAMDVSEGAARLSGFNSNEALDFGALALEAAADAQGATILHAACLRVPATDGWTLILAESGTGKTTASLALAKAGIGLAGDDAALLRVVDGTYLVTPIARELHVHERTIDLLPWLASVPSRPWLTEERAMSVADLGPVATIAEPEEARVAAIILLTRSDGPSRLEPLPPEALLPFIIADHVRMDGGRLPPEQVRRLDLVTGLAEAAPAYRLLSGDVSELPGLVSGLSA